MKSEDWRGLIGDQAETSSSQTYENPWGAEQGQAQQTTSPSDPQPKTDTLTPEQVRNRQIRKVLLFTLVGGFIAGIAERLLEEGFRISD